MSNFNDKLNHLQQILSDLKNNIHADYSIDDLTNNLSDEDNKILHIST